jgi:hypothetical protein
VLDLCGVVRLGRRMEEGRREGGKKGMRDVTFDSLRGFGGADDLCVLEESCFALDTRCGGGEFVCKCGCVGWTYRGLFLWPVWRLWGWVWTLFVVWWVGVVVVEEVVLSDRYR